LEREITVAWGQTDLVEGMFGQHTHLFNVCDQIP
jgi:hypothetical protein